MPPDPEVSRPQAAVTCPQREHLEIVSNNLPQNKSQDEHISSIKNENFNGRDTHSLQPLGTQSAAVAAGVVAMQSPLALSSRVYLSPALRATFHAVGATDEVYTFQEVLGFLKEYLYCNRHLFDPQDILYVNCTNDPLGDTFQVDRFHYNDVRGLVSKHVIPVRPDHWQTSGGGHGSRNRDCGLNSTTVTRSLPLERNQECVGIVNNRFNGWSGRGEGLKMPPDPEVSRPQAAVTCPQREHLEIVSNNLPQNKSQDEHISSIKNENFNGRDTHSIQPLGTQSAAVAAGVVAMQSPLALSSRVYLSPALRATFHAVGATDEVYTFQEVLGFLKEYLYCNRHLFDPQDILYVNCTNDPLGDTFQVDRFHYNDVRGLVSKHVIPVRPDHWQTSGGGHGSRNRDCGLNSTTVTRSLPLERNQECVGIVNNRFNGWSGRGEGLKMPPDPEVSRPQAAVTCPQREHLEIVSNNLPQNKSQDEHISSIKNENFNGRDTHSIQPLGTQSAAVAAGVVAMQSPLALSSRVYLSPALRATFHAVGATDEVYTFQEVLGFLKEYLYCNRHLFDPQDILYVNYTNDPLGDTFQVDRFYYNDVRGLVSKHVIPVRPDHWQTSGGGHGSRNRDCGLNSTTVTRSLPLERNQECVGIVNNRFNGLNSSLLTNGKSLSLESTVSSNSDVLNRCRSVQSQVYEDVENPHPSTSHAVPGPARKNIGEVRRPSRTIEFPVPVIPESHSDSEESIYSYQGYETALCRNTEFEDSDESAESEYVEYEIASDDDIQEQVLSDDDGDSVIEDVEVAVLCNDDNFEESFWADNSDSGQSTDEDLEHRQDNWECLTCGIKNKPIVRYCGKCWQIRKNWLPERPKRKRRKPRPKEKLRRTNSSFSDGIAADEIIIPEVDNSDLIRTSSSASTVSLQTDGLRDFNCLQLSSQDSGISRSQDTLTENSQDTDMDVLIRMPSTSKSASNLSNCVQSKASQMITNGTDSSSFLEVSSLKRKLPFIDENKAKTCRKDDEENECDIKGIRFLEFLKSEEGFKWVQSASFQEFKDEFLSESDAGSDEKHLCLICCSRPKNATIVHGRLSHQATCYQCARRLLNNGSRCPVCRRKIHMVSKNIIV